MFEKEIFNFIKNDKSYLERDPLQTIKKKSTLRVSSILVFGNAWIPLGKEILEKELRKRFVGAVKSKSLKR